MNMSNRLFPTVSYCGRIIARCPDGSIFFIQTPSGHLQFPGGNCKPQDLNNPRFTAARKFYHETRLYIEVDGLQEIKRRARPLSDGSNHIWVCYFYDITHEEASWYRPETDPGCVMRLLPETALSMVYSDGRGAMNIEQRELLTNFERILLELEV